MSRRIRQESLSASEHVRQVKGRGKTRIARRFVSAAIAAVLTLAAPAGAVVQRIVDNLYAADFVSADQGWVVGAFGTIYRTTDGGGRWEAQASGTQEPLFSVDFVNPRVGWAVGRQGVILHTRDGGARWRKQKASGGKHLFHVAALDERTAWAVGDWGAMFFTRDGGETWEDRSLERDVILYSQSWPDSQHGWIVGEAGTLLRTEDGGQTWQEQDPGVPKTLFGVHFTDRQNGWACGLDGLILRTKDGGASWQVLRGDPEIGALEQVGVAEAMENASLYDIVVHGKMGIAVGDIGTVFMSTDGGNTWQRKAVPTAWRLGWIRGVTLVSNGAGLFVGAGGLTVRIDGETLKPPSGS